MLRIDYIHGDRVASDLAAQPGNLGFFLPPLAKGELSRTVTETGVLPKKSFSMGEAEGKALLYGVPEDRVRIRRGRRRHRDQYERGKNKHAPIPDPE